MRGVRLDAAPWEARQAAEPPAGGVATRLGGGRKHTAVAARQPLLSPGPAATAKLCLHLLRQFSTSSAIFQGRTGQMTGAGPHHLDMHVRLRARPLCMSSRPRCPRCQEVCAWQVHSDFKQCFIP